MADGAVHDAVAPNLRGRSCGDPRRWARVGSRWHALDAWGQVVATKVVSAREDPPYDVTGCREVTLSPGDARDAARVFVSVDSAWSARPPAAWSPSAGERASFDALVAHEISDARVPAANVPAQCASVTERTRYVEAAGRRFAVGTTNAGYLVARQDPDRPWSIVAIDRSRVSTFDTVCYRALSVFDMNGDAVPEIVLRMSEGTSWGDFVLSLEADGRWRQVALSPGGSTA